MRRRFPSIGRPAGLGRRETSVGRGLSRCNVAGRDSTREVAPHMSVEAAA